MTKHLKSVPKPASKAALYALVGGALAFVGGLVLILAGDTTFVQYTGVGFSGAGLAAMGVSRLPGPGK